jgi:hypothetical protein
MADPSYSITTSPPDTDDDETGTVDWTPTVTDKSGPLD